MKLNRPNTNVNNQNPRDEVIRILGVKRNNKFGLLFRVEWKERRDGFKPTNSVVDNKFMRKNFPLLLLEYYEERMITLYHCKEIKKKFVNTQFDY
jgi:hypothetical protein